MKLLFLLILSFSSIGLFAEDFFAEVANTYEAATVPNFLPLIGKALPGRCYMVRGSNKRMASVLMVSFEEDGFDVAAFDADKKSEDFFDQMTYEDVLKNFPIIKKMFVNVNETANGAIIYKTENSDDYRAEIRESEKYLIMRVYINDQLTKYCNYQKK
jgi:hypothetical protein